jgi:hypothetical protein
MRKSATDDRTFRLRSKKRQLGDGRENRGRTSDGSRLIYVQDGRHALPLRKALLELHHLVFQRPNFLGDDNKLGVANNASEMHATDKS